MPLEKPRGCFHSPRQSPATGLQGACVPGRAISWESQLRLSSTHAQTQPHLRLPLTLLVAQEVQSAVEVKAQLLRPSVWRVEGLPGGSSVCGTHRS